MRILFVVTNVGVVESYGPMYLSSLAKSQGHEIRFTRFAPVSVEKAVRWWKPDVVAWSAYSGEFGAMAKTNDALKKKAGFVSVFGGVHATYFPEALWDHDINYGVMGEAENCFPALLDAISAHAPADHIPSVITREKPQNSLAPLVQDLDSLPMPDYAGYYAADPFLRGFPVKMFIPSRGCPFRCAYCFNHQFRALYKGQIKGVRRYGVPRLMDEVLYVKKNYPLEFVRFNDDCFVLKKDAWLEQFCQEFPRKVGLPFMCVMNPTTVKEETVAMLKEAGLASVFMAIECGDDQYRKTVLRRNISNPVLLDAFEIFARHKIAVWSTLMLGLPGTTFDHDVKTLNVALECQPSLINAPIFQPYPKLLLTRYAMENGHCPANMADGNKLFFGRSVLNFSQSVKNKQKNLSDVFHLMVQFPMLEKLLMPVIDHRLAILPFAVLSSLHNGYALQTKIFPHKMTPKRIFLNVSQAFKYFGEMLLGR